MRVLPIADCRYVFSVSFSPSWAKNDTQNLERYKKETLRNAKLFPSTSSPDSTNAAGAACVGCRVPTDM
jgi:hypothetical protein